jgi:CheY-like chemotaxis protein
MTSEVSQRGLVILLVEDDADLRAAFRESLEDRGCAVVEADGGRAALAYLTSDAPVPALVLADVMMPGMSGPELRGAIAKIDRLAHVPVLLMSALQDARGQRTDVPVLTKPIGAEATEAFFDSVLDILRGTSS